MDITFFKQIVLDEEIHNCTFSFFLLLKKTKTKIKNDNNNKNNGTSDDVLCSVPTMKLLGITLRNRCWPSTCHTIVTINADGWCQ